MKNLKTIEAYSIYEILVKYLKLRNDKIGKRSWLRDLTQDDNLDLRLDSGDLFFIGKLHRHSLGNCVYVSVYKENITPKIEQLLKEVNLELWKIKIDKKKRKHEK